MTIQTTHAVVAACDRCGRRSPPIDPASVEDWARGHDAEHARLDRRERLAADGHEVREVVEWFDNDDSRGYARCSCGWASKPAKTCWSGVAADQHLEDVDRALDEEERRG